MLYVSTDFSVQPLMGSATARWIMQIKDIVYVMLSIELQMQNVARENQRNLT